VTSTTRRNERATAIGLCALALAACSSTATSDAGPAGSGGAAGTTGNAAGAVGSAASAGQADASQLVGTFQVKLRGTSGDASAGTAVVGRVYDGPTPDTIIWENPEVDGACTLTTPRVPFCSAPCGGSAACIEDDTCLSYPTARSVGNVTVTGLGDAPFTMTPIANTYQPPAGVTLAFPPFAEGAPLTFSAAGDYFPAFSLTGKGIAPLVLTTTTLALKSGVALPLTWIPGAPGNSTIHVKLDISHHGGSKGQIVCDSDDSGSLTVTAALITKLVSLGVAGYPSVIVTRRALGSSVIAAGRVDLEIASVVEQSVSVEGLTSCTNDTDCPSGESCQVDLSCK
jgi:hypothetical protein